jgi:RimJ/RimL family protein N-acetyltransferase
MPHPKCSHELGRTNQHANTETNPHSRMVLIRPMRSNTRGVRSLSVVMTSSTRNHTWRPDVNEAVYDSADHAAPNPDCECGLYAFHRPPRLKSRRANWPVREAEVVAAHYRVPLLARGHLHALQDSHDHLTPGLLPERTATILVADRSRLVSKHGKLADYRHKLSTVIGSAPKPPMGLCDELVLLRPWREEDIPHVVRAVRDHSIERWNHLPQPFNEEAVRNWFVAIPAQIAAGVAMRLLVVDVRRDADLLGAIAIFNIAASRESAEIGCWVAAKSREHGVAFRAVRLMIDCAVAMLRIEEVFAEVDADNRTAQDLLVRGGFMCRDVIPGSEPTALRYAIAAKDARWSSTTR